jgi:hypothetical protein
MVVNVCPAAVTSASPDRVWGVLIAPERLGEWSGAKFVSADPPGPARPDQTIQLTASFLGRKLPVTIVVRDMDPRSRWIDFLVHLPLGVDNYEHVTLTETKTGGTLVRFN